MNSQLLAVFAATIMVILAAAYFRWLKRFNREFERERSYVEDGDS